MKIAFFYADTCPTLFEKAAQKSGFEAKSFHCKEIQNFLFDPLDDFSAVLVRNCWGYEQEVALLGSACKQQKISLIDSALYEPFFDSKALATQLLAPRGLPLPRTFFINKNTELSHVFDRINFPLVAKRIRSSRFR